MQVIINRARRPIRLKTQAPHATRDSSEIKPPSARSTKPLRLRTSIASQPLLICVFAEQCLAFLLLRATRRRESFPRRQSQWDISGAERIGYGFMARRLGTGSTASAGRRAGARRAPLGAQRAAGLQAWLSEEGDTWPEKGRFPPSIFASRSAKKATRRRTRDRRTSPRRRSALQSDRQNKPARDARPPAAQAFACSAQAQRRCMREARRRFYNAISRAFKRRHKVSTLTTTHRRPRAPAIENS